MNYSSKMPEAANTEKLTTEPRLLKVPLKKLRKLVKLEIVTLIPLWLNT